MAQSILYLSNISKRYGAHFALEDVTFDVQQGEIHAILGENGAGKSTLVKIISGQVIPTSGRVQFAGDDVALFTPAHARRLGVAMVQQELSVFDDLSVAENIFPDHRFAARGRWINWSRLNAAARQACEAVNFSVDVRTKVGSLSSGRKQLVEILRCINSDARVLVLDEPTSGLNTHETEALIRLLKTLRERAVTILYISHRIPEVLALSDRITILRDGKKRATLVNKDLNQNLLVRAMVGRELQGIHGHVATVLSAGQPALRAQTVSGYGLVRDVDLHVRRGEIVGVFGLEGSGFFELAELLAGVRRRRNGILSVNQKQFQRWSPRVLARSGVQYLHYNRKEAGLYLAMDVSENAAAPRLSALSRLGLVDRKALAHVVRSSIQRFGIKCRPSGQRVINLSGGNQQKLMLSLCLDCTPACFVVSEPTRGVDVGAKAEIHNILRNIAASGGSILLFSSELPELLALATTILIMRDGRIARQVTGKEISEESVMAFAAGTVDG